MFGFKLRLNVIENVDNEVYQKIESYMARYIRCYESGGTGDNPHYHYYLFFKQGVKKDTFRTCIRKTLGAGNGVYSLKEISLEKEDEPYGYPIAYIAYVLKQGDVKYQGDWPVEVLDMARDYDNRVKNDLKRCRLGKKNGNSSRLIKVLEYCIEMGVFISPINNPVEITIDNVFEGAIITSDDSLIDAVVQYHTDNNLIINKNQIINIVTSILVRFDKNYRVDFIRDIKHAVGCRR